MHRIVIHTMYSDILAFSKSLFSDYQDETENQKDRPWILSPTDNIDPTPAQQSWPITCMLKKLITLNLNFEHENFSLTPTHRYNKIKYISIIKKFLCKMVEFKSIFSTKAHPTSNKIHRLCMRSTLTCTSTAWSFTTATSILIWWIDFFNPVMNDVTPRPLITRITCIGPSEA